MKKGCFFSSVIFVTIVIGLGIYLFRKYSPQIKDFGKEKIVQMTIEEIDKKIDEVEYSVYRDSLKIFLKDQSKKISKYDFEDAMGKFGNIAEQIRFFIKDKKIDSIEFTALKNMAIKDEGSKEN